MRQALARRLLVPSLVVAGAAALGAGCSSSDPPLPPSATIPIAAVAPPPISGGTLLVTQSGLAVAADSDRDVVWIVSSEAKVTKVALQAGDEPGRLTEDGAGRVHVALRGAGEVVTIDPTSAKVIDRTPVCAAPRGIAYDPSTNVVRVACSGGELVSLPAAGGAPVGSMQLAKMYGLSDLRDVIVQPGGGLILTRFRHPEVITLDAHGGLLSRATPPSPNNGNDSIGGTFSPTVAWRAIPVSGGGLLVAHQLAADTQVVISQPGGYGGGDDQNGCDLTIVKSTVTAFTASGQPVSPDVPAPTLIGATLPVDLAVNGTGVLAVVSAGSDSVFTTDAIALEQGSSSGGCNQGQQMQMPGQPVAVSDGGNFTSKGFVVQLREPPALVVIDNSQIVQTIKLPGESRADTGHSIFHHQASNSSFIACAGCHPEGREDGHVWSFDTEGKRRTPTVAGGVLDTVPLHWNGDMHDLGDIMEEVFVRRMGGAHQGPQHVAAFADWLNAIPPTPASPLGSEDQIARGKQIFERADVGCTGCHGGAHFTNNLNENVGTGRAFQVPQLLGVAARTPLMHDGCAKTLQDRFDTSKESCNGGDKHGHWTTLSSGEINDLIAYLETL